MEVNNSTQQEPSKLTDAQKLQVGVASTSDVFEWLEKMSVAAERRYIISSYPANSTQATPDRL